MMQMGSNEIIEAARKILSENIYMTIATVSPEGEPWISPVFFAYDENYNLFWTSDKDSRHSQNLNRNSKVAIVVFNSQAPEGEGDGVYVEADIKELSEEKEVLRAIQILGQRVTIDKFRVTDVDQVTRGAQWRIYKATPYKTWKLGEGEIIHGQYIDKRVEIQLSGE